MAPDVLELSATDTALTGTDTVTIIIKDLPPETKSFQDGVLPTIAYKGTRDTKLRGDKLKNNFGKDKVLETLGKPDVATLLQWDLSSSTPVRRSSECL